MSQPKGGSEGPKKKWAKVTASYKVRGGASRKSPAVTVTEAGAVETTVLSAALLDATAVARGMDATKDYNVNIVIDEERDIIGVYATNEVSANTVPTRRYKNGPSTKISFHIGAAFIEKPHLRPEYKKVEVLVYQETDDYGLPIMTIPIKAGKAKITQSRSDDGTPGSQAAAGGQTPKS
ncbi:MAG: hypothetical protein ACOY94_12880 [Bacillota bacterium]